MAVLALRAASIAGLTCFAVFGLPRLYTAWRYGVKVVAENQVAAAPVAIVFGAGLQRNGEPTLVLRDRVQMAARLYQAGKVQKLLLSGDNRFDYYNEPKAMFDYGLRLGLPANAMVLDYAGRRTYDTCLRARQIFGVTDAVLVTQDYHLDRALLTCDALGLRVQGVAADLSAYSRRTWTFWWLRELPATTQALWDIYISPPSDVVLGRPEPISF